MGKITIHLLDYLENTFRKLARQKFGDRNSKLSKAAIEALDFWCKHEQNKYT